MQSGLFHEIHQKSRLSMKEVNETLKEYGLFSSQWTILYLLKRSGPLTQTEIWQYLNVEAPTVTRTLVRLEETGWVHRAEGTDKRSRIVRLTEKAEGRLPEIEARIAALEARMVEALSEEEQKQLIRLLRKVKASANGSKEELHE